MYQKKIVVVQFTILITFLISSCNTLKHSNFNRQHYLDLRINKSKLISDSTLEKYLYQEEISCASISVMNINPDEEISQNNFEQINETDSILDKESAVIECTKSDNPNFNDTLIFKSGLRKTVEISTWDNGSVKYKYTIRGNIKERSLETKALSCFVVYDSLDQFVYAEGECFIPITDSSGTTIEKNQMKNTLNYREKMGLATLFLFMFICSLPILLILWILYQW